MVVELYESDLTRPLTESLLQRILFRIQLLKDVVVGNPDQ